MVKTLVLGASTNLGGYSNRAMNRLVDHSVETEAFGIWSGTVVGVQVKDGFGDFEDIDTVTLYLNPKRQMEHTVNTRVSSFSLWPLNQ